MTCQLTGFNGQDERAKELTAYLTGRRSDRLRLSRPALVTARASTASVLTVMPRRRGLSLEHRRRLPCAAQRRRRKQILGLRHRHVTVRQPMGPPPGVGQFEEQFCGLCVLHSSAVAGDKMTR